MEKIFNILIATLAIVGVACTSNDGGGPGSPSPLTFNLRVTFLSTDTAKVEVNPSDNGGFYFDVVEKAAFEEYESDEAFINHVVEDLKTQHGNNLSGADRFQGKEWLYEGTLTPNTDYYIYVFGVTAAGEVTTGLTKFAFRTLAVNEGGDKDINNLVWGRLTGYGDEYSVGAKNWIFVLYDETRTSELNIELQTELSATEPTLGEYPINSSLDAGTAIAGALDQDGYIYGTYWENSVEKVFCKSGTVTIGKSGDIYTINLNAIDEQDNTITMSYSGELEITYM